MTYSEYCGIVEMGIAKGVKQINLLGGEPFLHPDLHHIIRFNNSRGLKTTIYTNGTIMASWSPEDLQGAKLRVSIYSGTGKLKGMHNLYDQEFASVFDANFMVGAKTSLNELLYVARSVEEDFHCRVFFISSLRECDGCNDFFYDTPRTMPVMQYKELVHRFLYDYSGDMEIHISKRGVFESTTSLPHCKCKFANVFVGGKVIQCPYDVINLKFQDGYEFDQRHCQQNNTCLMSKIKVQRRRSDA
jgi:hypothetical protein